MSMEQNLQKYCLLFPYYLGSFSTYKEYKQIMFNMFNTAIYQLL